MESLPPKVVHLRDTHGQAGGGRLKSQFRRLFLLGKGVRRSWCIIRQDTRFFGPLPTSTHYDIWQGCGSPNRRVTAAARRLLTAKLSFDLKGGRAIAPQAGARKESSDLVSGIKTPQ
jgi:hypothetical protein